MLLKSKVFLLRGQISVGWPDALRKTGQFSSLELTFRHKFYRGSNVYKTFLLLVLVGCAASAKKIKGPDGSDHLNSIHNVNHGEETHLLVKCEQKK